MIYGWWLAYSLLGAVLFGVFGEWQRPGPCSLGVAVFLYFGNVVRLALWPLVLVGLLLNRLQGSTAPQWQIDFEGVELFTREAVARDIEEYRDHMVALFEKEGGTSDHLEFTVNVYNDVAKVVRHPELWRRHRAEVEE